MRMLFSFTGGLGHFVPLIPYLQAALHRGHEVVVGCQPAMVGKVTAAGFPAADTGGITMVAGETRLPLRPVDRAHEVAVIRDVFAGRIAAERASRLTVFAHQWRPDVIVRDEVDFGAVIAAENLGLPHVAVIVLAAGGLITPALVGDAIARLRADHGLAADPELSALHRHLTLVPVPPRFRDPTDPLPETARHVRPWVTAGRVDAATDRTRRWLDSRPDRRTVYVTLGTVFPQESGDLFRRILAGVRELNADAVVTVGPELDPAEFGDQPDTVLIERYLDQREILARSDVVVSHGGSGSVISALGFGLPLVLLPLGADQPLNGDRCRDLGVGRVLDAVAATPSQIGTATAEVLTEPSYRECARLLAAETAALPSPAQALIWIEHLAAPA